MAFQPCVVYRESEYLRTVNICVAGQKIVLKIFRFPKSEELRNCWLRFVDRQKFQPSQWSTVCSLHFEPDCFIPNKKRRVLKNGAVPSIFPSFPSRTIPLEKCVAHDHTYLLPPAKELKRNINFDISKDC